MIQVALPHWTCAFLGASSTQISCFETNAHTYLIVEPGPVVIAAAGSGLGPWRVGELRVRRVFTSGGVRTIGGICVEIVELRELYEVLFHPISRYFSFFAGGGVRSIGAVCVEIVWFPVWRRRQCRTLELGDAWFNLTKSPLFGMYGMYGMYGTALGGCCGDLGDGGWMLKNSGAACCAGDYRLFTASCGGS